MTDTAQRSSSRRWLLLGAAFLVLCGWIAWNGARSKVRRDDLATGGSSSSGATLPPSESPSPAKETARRPGKSDASDDESAQRKMDLWLADPKLEPAEAARRLWHMASDRKYSEAVRMDALANGLNLTEDQQFKTEFLPDLGAEGLWTGDLGEALLDDLYNRTDQVKVSAAAALLPHADGDFKDHLRDVLRFQLDAEDADDATLIQLAQKKAAEPEEQEDSH